MKLALALALLPLPLFAEVVTTFQPTNPFAVVTLYNREEVGLPRQVEIQVDTDYGPVILLHEMTPNYPVERPDSLTVISLPAGVIANPEKITVDEHQSGKIELYYWEGM